MGRKIYILFGFSIVALFIMLVSTSSIITNIFLSSVVVILSFVLFFVFIFMYVLPEQKRMYISIGQWISKKKYKSSMKSIRNGLVFILIACSCFPLSLFMRYLVRDYHGSKFVFWFAPLAWGITFFIIGIFMIFRGKGD